jgi:fused signal recognition particle receptor
MVMLRNLAWLGVVLAVISLLSLVAVYHSGFNILELAAAHSSWAAYFFAVNNPLPLVIHHYSLVLLVLLVLIVGCAAFWQSVNRLTVILTGVFMLVLLVQDIALALNQIPASWLRCLGTACPLQSFLAYLLVWTWYWLSLRLQPGIVTLAPLANLKTGLRFVVGVGIVLLLPLYLNATVWDGGAYSEGLHALLHTVTALLKGQPLLDAELFAARDFIFSHATLAAVITLLLAVLAVYTLLSKQVSALRNAGIFLSVLLLATVLSGVVAIDLSWLTLLHSGFAALLMLPLLAIRFYARYTLTEAEHTLREPAPSALAQKEALTVPTPIATPEAEQYVAPAPESLYLRLKTQLKRTRSGLGTILAGISLGQRKIDADLLEEIEASLIMADVGMDATMEIIGRLSERVDRQQLSDAEALTTALKQELLEMLEPCSRPLLIPQQDNPYVILVVGINGAGKTTTIGKIAKRLQAQGHSVMLAAGDTFRAAAVEQLQVWGQRNAIHVVAQHTGADSASVIYDGVQSALAKGVDVLIADTAGRLHTKSNLMEELKKIKRIMAKLDESAPHEVLLVLDAGTGQNALSQTKLFNEAVALSGLVLTKLDGTAKGGIIFALAKQFGLPIRYIGIGEGIDDLQHFDATAFVDALFVKDE